MKITKARLQQIIKEEIEGTQEQSYTFEIYRPGHYGTDLDTTIMYVDNVPMSMIDVSQYEMYKSTAPNPERFYKISKEGMQKLGFKLNEYGNLSVRSKIIDEIPERIEVTVPYNPRTGEFMLDNLRAFQNPKVVDASGM